MKSIACFFAVAVLFTACESTKKMNSLDDPRTGGQQPSTTFDTQGHRGCRGLMPENTIPAMLHALQLGVITLEMDVVITKDKQVVLSHEPFFNHEIATKPDGTEVSIAEERDLNIYQMNYSDVARFDVGLRPHPRFPQQKKMAVTKPLLRDLFDSVTSFIKSTGRPFPYFNIETKCLPIGDNRYHPEPAAFVALLMDVIAGKKMENYVTIQSFDFRTLQYLHKNWPGITTAMLIEENDRTSLDEQLSQLGFVPSIYSPHFTAINAAIIKACREKKIRVIPWTVNDKAAIDRLKAMGVDGIISDYPNLF